MVLCWSRADTEQFGKLAAGMGFTAAMSANPLLLIVAVVAFARAFSKAKAEGRYGDAIDGIVRGIVTSVAVLGSVALVSSAGSAGLAMLVALVVGLVVSELAANVSVSEVAGVVAARLRKLAAHMAAWKGANGLPVG